jgi:hypothetical protein
MRPLQAKTIGTTVGHTGDHYRRLQAKRWEITKAKTCEITTLENKKPIQEAHETTTSKNHRRPLPDTQEITTGDDRRKDGRLLQAKT